MEKNKEEQEIKDADKKTKQSEKKDVTPEVEKKDTTVADSTESEKASSAQPTQEETIATLQQQIDEWKDKYLRQAAEFDNYRKRVVKEKSELILNGGQKVVQAILPIIDDFERAETSIEKMEDIKAAKEGVQLIIDKFLKLLGQEGLKPIDAVGQPFDVDYHEAIAMIPAQNDEQKGKVIDCVQTGYMLNEKVIRHAKVAVAQ